MRSGAVRGASLLAACVLAGCGGGDGGGGDGDAAAGAGASSELVVDLGELNGSGQTGTATLTPSGDGTLVTVETVSYLVDPQPAGVYRGTCAEPGARAYELATIEDGISVTTVDVTVADLRGGAYVVGIAKSRKQPDVRVACGEIG